MQTHASLMSVYRPDSIETFCMDPVVKTAISQLVEIGELNMLLVGGTCSGKTTLLNAVVRKYYGLEKHAPLPESSLLFVNNLKEQGIGFYRNEMKTFCQSRGGIAGKKKMVVIDDIDMINEQSQQILRTYIDKYSANVHFVSVCANLHKVIESIQSRMHVMRIRQPSREQVAQMVDRVIETEALSVDLDARRFLLEYCNYSVRPVLNYLEKIKILEIAVSREVCETVVSEISFAKFEIFVAALRAADLRAAVRVLYDLHDHGYSVIDVLEYVFVFVKITESLSDAEKYAVLPLICKYIAIFNMTHEHHIELALFANNMLAALSTPKN